jgi:hypothetical protein
VKKQTSGLKRKTCGIFTKDLPEWLTVKGASDLGLDWCVWTRLRLWLIQRGFTPALHFSCGILTWFYLRWILSFVPNGCLLCPTGYGTARCSKFCWLRPRSWKSVYISIKHADVGGCSNITRSIRDYVRQSAWLVDLKVLKRGPRMVSSFCRDNHFGVAVPTV